MRGAMLQMMVLLAGAVYVVVKLVAGVLRLGFFLIGGVALLGLIGGTIVWAFTGKSAGLVHGGEAVGAYLLVYLVVTGLAAWLPKKLAEWHGRIEREQWAKAMPEDARFSDEIAADAWREAKR